MVKQYPHSAIAKTAGNSVKDSEGEWVKVGEETILETDCRAEPAKANQYLEGADGKRITLVSVVYMPIPPIDLEPGTLFEVRDGEKLIVRETVKQYSRGQLNARVWL